MRTDDGSCQARGGSAVGTIGGKLYVLGGEGGYSNCGKGGTFSSAVVFDPESNSWSVATNMSTPRMNLAAGVVEGKLYAVGGFSSENKSALSSMEIYDPSTNSWSAGAPMKDARGKHAAGVLNNKLYVMGGTTSFADPISGMVKSVEVYDPANGAWAACSNIDSPRYGLAVVAAFNGLLYALGGNGDISEPGHSSYASAYDPIADDWQMNANMPSIREGVGAGVLNGKIYVFGGSLFDGSSWHTTSKVEVYDPFIDSWSTAPDMGVARWFMGAGQTDERIYVFGGYGTLQGGKNTYLKSVEAYRNNSQQQQSVTY